MVVTAIKTNRITPGSIELLPFLDEAIEQLEEGSVVAITSKVVSLCEDNVVPFDAADIEQLIVQEADWYLPRTLSKYGYTFSIVNNRLISVAGIDESNGDGNYILWPKDAQATANTIRTHLKDRFKLRDVGVIITDSTSHPLRRGTNGMMLAHSGFQALNDYVGKPDLFGRPFAVSQADVAGGLAAAGVLQMGEGAEQTPIAVLTDLPFVTFQDRDPTDEELAVINIPLEDDLFAPFTNAAPWQPGGRKKK